MRTLTTMIFCTIFFCFAEADGLEISYSRINPFTETSIYDTLNNTVNVESILLKGEIFPGDYNRLLDFIRIDTNRFWRSHGFILASPGGDIEEALWIARLVKGTYAEVFVGPATGPCVSACFFIFASAARREAHPGSLGVHRPYVHPKHLISLSPLQAESLQKDILKRARLQLEDLQVPTSIIDTMFQRASTEVYWLTKLEIEDQLGRRPPWYEQFLIARCGLDKNLEKHYFQTNDSRLLKRVLDVDSCGLRLSRPDSERFLNAEFRNGQKP